MPSRRRGGFRVSLKRRFSAAKNFAKRHSRKIVGLAGLGAAAYYGHKYGPAHYNAIKTNAPEYYAKGKTKLHGHYTNAQAKFGSLRKKMFGPEWHAPMEHPENIDPAWHPPMRTP